MSLVWHFYWPAVLAAFLIGVVGGRIALREREPDDRSRRRKFISGAIGLYLAAVVLWHVPLGAASRMVGSMESSAAAELRRQGMTSVTVKIERAPIRRSFIIQGAADNFQSRELVRIMADLPGSAGARWISPKLGSGTWLPLLVEAELLALVGFLLGLFLAYLMELRRRSNAEWSW